MLDWGIPVLLGMSAVLQATINRSLAASSSLSTVVVWNSVMVLVYALTLNSVLKEKLWVSGGFPYLVIVSGLFGFAIVVGFPFAISRIGAVATSILFILSQLATSALWDILVDGVRLSAMRWAALALAGLSAVLFTVGK